MISEHGCKLIDLRHTTKPSGHPIQGRKIQFDGIANFAEVDQTSYMRSLGQRARRAQVKVKRGDPAIVEKLCTTKASFVGKPERKSKGRLVCTNASAAL
jgi:hypothetical protein